ncbi:DMT family transporter [Alphaproteobacteria bacterium]|nr:DMT family transporter [Alphaproteobacteria bacterium]
MNSSVNSGAIKGALWMLMASFCYVASATLTRYLDGSYDTFQLAFLRCTVGVCVLTPIVLGGGIDQLKTKIIHIHGLRMVVTYIAILFWFYAAESVPVGDFFAIQFATPLFTIGAAALLLRETVTLKSWLAAIVGFCGVLIIVRPGYIPISIGVLAAIATALTYALVNTLIKVASRHDSPTVMTFYVNVLILPVSAIPAYFVWKTPQWEDVPILLGIALFATLAQFCVANSISLADARVVQPMNFMRMPMAALLGFLVFSEFPDMWTWVGALIIFVAAWYAVQHAAAARKKAAT